MSLTPYKPDELPVKDLDVARLIRKVGHECRDRSV